MHSSADGTYGTWTYSYDDSGNITQTVDPKNQTVNYTYDDLNRVLTENYTGQTGTEVSYSYDTGTDGIGRVITANNNSANNSYLYNAAGSVKTETKTIDSVPYATAYVYDRQGNVTLITYPDSSEVRYTYNTAGLLEKIEYKENGGSFGDIVSILEYGPTEQLIYKKLANDTESTYTYNSNNLYRLTNILTENTISAGGPEQSLSLEEILSEFDSKELKKNPKGKSNIKELSNKFELQKGDKSIPTTDTRVQASKDSPEVRIKKWGGEVNLGVSYKNIDSKVAYDEKDQSFKWADEKNKETLHAYEIEPNENLLNGGFEIEVILDEKPKNNNFDFSIDNADKLDFFYQPGLDEEFKDVEKEGDCSETSCNGFERPENVVGSYAVYYKNKSGSLGEENYQTGKAFHIYRPKIVDAKGEKVWGELKYSKGQLTVIVPQDFLDKATYPVIVDPTFGYSSVGASTSWKVDDIRGAQGIPVSSGTVDSVSVYIDSGWASGEEQKAILYDENANVIAETQESTQGGSGWVTLTFANPPSVTANTKYLLGVFQDDSIKYAYDSTSGLKSPNHDGGAGTYPTTPNPSGISTSFQFSVYANYTETPAETGPIQDISYSYDNSGNITQVLDISGNGLAKTVNYTYDDLYRLTNASTSSQESDPFDQDFTYNSIGNITSSHLGSYNYSSAGYTNPHAVTGIGSDTYSYDNNGNMTDYSGKEYSWDYKNRLVSFSDGNSSPLSEIKIYEDSLQSPWADWSWGSTRDFSGSTTVYAGTDSLKMVYTQNWGGLQLYQNNLDLTGKTDLQFAIHGGSTGGQDLYLYLLDSLGDPMLPSVMIGDYIQGGISSGSWDLVTIPLSDLQGLNQTIDGIAIESSTATTIYLDSLKFIQSNSNPTNTFAYDYSDQRIKKDNTVYPNKYHNTNGTKTTLHIYDNKGSLVSTIEKENSQSTFSYIHTDHLGGTNVTTDISGIVKEVVDYFPFGKQRVSTTTGSIEQRKFTGHEYDQDTDLTYANSRYYDQNVGRFVSVDPVYLNIGVANTKEEHQALQKLLSDPQALNSYAYSRNNPVLYIDPTGEFFSLPFIANSQWGQSTAMAMDQTVIGSWALDNPGMPAIVGAAPLAVYGASAGLTYLSIQYAGGFGTACMAFCGRSIENAQRISISADRFSHVLDRHAYNTTQANVSTFSKGVDIKRLIQEASGVNPKIQLNGNLERVYNAGKDIGIDRATGKPTSLVTVITNNSNELITSFPGTPVVK